MAQIIKTGSNKLLLTDTEEQILVPTPPEGERYIVTLIRYLQNDTVPHVPKLRVRDDSQRATEELSTNEEAEYHPLIPQGDGARAFTEGEFFEMTAPVWTLQNIPGDKVESIVIEEDVEPTDTNSPTSIMAMWLVEVDS